MKFQSLSRRSVFSHQRLLLVAALIVSPLTAHADSYDLDPGHTYPSFSVSHLGFSTMQGRFNSSAGSFEYDPASGVASVEVVIETASIDTGHEKRDEHLRNADFFDTDQFPEMTFKSTESKFDGETLVSVTGDLTILGVSKPTTLMIDSVKCGEHPMNGKQVCGFNASGAIVRSDWNMNYGIPAIGEEITLTIAAEGVLK